VGGRLSIAFLGTADFAIPTLRALASGPDEIVAVFTRPDRPAGRGRRLRASPVRVTAEELGLPLFQPPRVSSEQGLRQLRDLSPDLIFVAAFGELLSEEAISAGSLGAVNLHASLLPAYRGAAPIQRALLAGETRTGVTVQWMALAMDTGDIILQRPLDIAPDESFGSLSNRLAALGAETARDAVSLLRQRQAPRTPQVHEKATYAPAVRREELEIDWRRPAVVLTHMVRAFSPRPGARTTRGGRLLKVLSAREDKHTGGSEGIPGQVMEVVGEGFRVGTGKGRLLVLQVHPEGRSTMSAADYVKGYRLACGERLGREDGGGQC
jgi:methionyl-tRNA formyltransferase